MHRQPYKFSISLIRNLGTLMHHQIPQLLSETSLKLHYLLYEKRNEMGRVCSTMGEKRNAFGVYVGNPEGNRALKEPTHRWDNIKMDLR
jgi:hypothetical protein